MPSGTVPPSAATPGRATKLMTMTRPALTRTGITRELKTGATAIIADNRVAMSMNSAACGASWARI